ncbi:MAG: RNA polymerase sigma factor [Planctomycetota bacterium]
MLSQKAGDVSVKEERQIVEAARNGDVESFGRLYERYYAAMVWLAYSIVAERSLAEDAAQQTFALACEKLAGLKEPGRFAGWLSGICRNVARQMVRERSRQVLVNDPPSAVEESEDEGVEEVTREAIGTLPEMYREALVLRYWNDMSYEQMAPILGICRSRVKGRLFRARRMVARYLKSKGSG